SRGRFGGGGYWTYGAVGGGGVNQLRPAPGLGSVPQGDGTAGGDIPRECSHSGDGSHLRDAGGSTLRAFCGVSVPRIRAMSSARRFHTPVESTIGDRPARKEANWEDTIPGKFWFGTSASAH